MNRRILFIFAALSVLIPALLAWGQTAPTTAPATQPLVQFPVYPTTRISPSGVDDWPAITAAWAKHLNVQGAAGVYFLSKPLNHVPHCGFVGVGERETFLVPLPGCPVIVYGSYGDPAYPQDGSFFSGFTVDSSLAPGVHFCDGATAEGDITVSHVTLIDASSGTHNWPGVTWLDDTFVGSCIQSFDAGATFNGCKWIGPPAFPGNELDLSGSKVTIENSNWLGACRGIDINGALSGAWIYNDIFEDVNANPGQNDNEVILEESSGPITNSIFDTILIHGCRGRPVALDYGGANGNTFIRFDIDGGEGFSAGFNNTMGHQVFGNHFTQWQMTHCVCFSLNEGWSNVVDNFNIVDPGASWCNQMSVGQVECPKTFFVETNQGNQGNKIDYPNSVTVSGMNGRLVGVGGS